MSVIDCLSDPLARQDLHNVMQKQVGKCLSQHGAAAFAMPRDLAVCHEVGHIIVAAADCVTATRVEVFGETAIQRFRKNHGRYPTKGERRRLAAAGHDLTLRQWGGYTTWGPSPFFTDRAGTKFDLKIVEMPVFEHHVRMMIGGICGECVLYHSAVPEGSSLDEIMLAQSLCFDRTGAHESARNLWDDLWRQVCITIKRHEAIARKLMTAFDQKDIVEGPELHAILILINEREEHESSE